MNKTDENDSQIKTMGEMRTETIKSLRGKLVSYDEAVGDGFATTAFDWLIADFQRELDMMTQLAVSRYVAKIEGIAYVAADIMAQEARAEIGIPITEDVAVPESAVETQPEAPDSIAEPEVETKLDPKDQKLIELWNRFGSSASIQGYAHHWVPRLNGKQIRQRLRELGIDAPEPVPSAGRNKRLDRPKSVCELASCQKEFVPKNRKDDARFCSRECYRASVGSVSEIKPIKVFYGFFGIFAEALTASRTHSAPLWRLKESAIYCLPRRMPFAVGQLDEGTAPYYEPHEGQEPPEWHRQVNAPVTATKPEPPPKNHIRPEAEASAPRAKELKVGPDPAPKKRAIQELIRDNINKVAEWNAK